MSAVPSRGTHKPTRFGRQLKLSLVQHPPSPPPPPLPHSHLSARGSLDSADRGHHLNSRHHGLQRMGQAREGVQIGRGMWLYIDAGKHELW